MKKISLICLAASLLLFMSNIQTVNGQKVVTGDLSFLKGQKSINVVFDYSGMKIEKQTEAEFVASEAQAKEAKEAGTGEKFKADWEKDKAERYLAAFNKILGAELQIKTDDPAATYTLIVYNIDLTNKGWGNKFSGGNPASMNVDFKFVETANQANTLCEIKGENIRYMATTGTVAQKIQGCLEYGGRVLAKMMKRYL